MTTQIRSLSPDVSIFSTQFNRFGIFAIGARATALKLSNNDIVIVSAIAHTPKIASHLESMGGRVGYLVAPDREHHLQLEAWAKLYPTAKIVGVEGVPEKHPTLKFHKVFGEAAYDSVDVGWERDIQTQYFAGHVNKELALLHKKSKVLVEADLMFNLPAYEQYPHSAVGSGAGLIGGWLSPFRFLSATSGTHKFFNYYVAAKDKANMIAGLDAMRAWDFEKIVPCHGEVVEKDAKAVWYDSFSWLFIEKKRA